MKITLKLAQLMPCSTALQSLGQTTVSAILGLKIVKAAKAIGAETELLQGAVKKLAEKYDASPEGKLPDKNVAAYGIEVKELLESDVEVEVPIIELNPKLEIPNAAAVLDTLSDFVSVIGADAPEPRKPNPKGADGKPISNAEFAQQRVDEATAKAAGPTAVVE